MWDGAITDINFNTVFLDDTFGSTCDFWSTYTMHVDRSDDIKAGFFVGALEHSNSMCRILWSSCATK
jgi:hypothetical protein